MTRTLKFQVKGMQRSVNEIVRQSIMNTTILIPPILYGSRREGVKFIQNGGSDSDTRSKC